MHSIDPALVPDSPSWVIDMTALEHNLRILADVQERAGCKILIALKGFATWSTFPLVRKYLSGATASAPHEARLAHEKLGGELHAYAPAYSDSDISELLPICDHLVFNSLSQWQRFRSRVEAHNKAHPDRRVSCGLRINPEHREVAVALYDPCAPGSRLGVTREALRSELMEGLDGLDGLEGLHFHTLCELDSDALERTVAAVEEKFGDLLPKLKWLNLGGGHHITRPGYDTDRLVRIVKRLRERYGVAVYLEPGEAVAIRTGVLVATVLDVVENNGPIAILDTSATAHMPDVREMPYRPEVVGAGNPGEKAHNYRLGGLTCLAGDMIGEYSFDHPLVVGERIVLLDMSHYTMVKTSNFNGVRLPSIVLRHQDGQYELVKQFGYEVYRDRLG